MSWWIVIDVLTVPYVANVGLLGKRQQLTRALGSVFFCFGLGCFPPISWKNKKTQMENMGNERLCCVIKWRVAGV